MKCLFLALEGFTAEAWNAARAAGKLPALDTAVAAGVAGELTFSLADARVAMLVSAMTGTWPDQHGILLAQTGDPAARTRRPAGVEDRREPAFWELTDAYGVAGISVGWPLAITGETGNTAIVAAGFGDTPRRDFQPDVRRWLHPADLSARLADCWLRPDELETGVIAALAPQWWTVNQTVDNRLGLLARVLAENLSRHAAFLELLDTQPAGLASLCLSLPGELASLERASQPFADGLFDGLGERALPLVNALLAEILKRVPATTQVVLAGLPQAETPARPGFVLVSGPPVNPAACLRMASVLDLAPLVWQICGYRQPGLPDSGLSGIFKTVPAGRDFDRPGKLPGKLPGERAPDFAALLAVPEPQAGPPDRWHRETLSLLGRSRMARQDWLGALPVLAAGTRLAPDDVNAQLRLGACQQALGLLEEALDTAYAGINPQFGGDPTPLLRAAELEALMGRPDRARQLLGQAAPALAAAPHLRALHADVLIYLRAWEPAAALWSALVAETPQNAYAQMRLARCHIAQHDWQAAFDCALASAKLQAANARNCELLGHALMGMGWQEQAWQAFEAATAANPSWPRPWAKLVWLARRLEKPEAEIVRLTSHFQRLKEAEQERQKTGKASARAVLAGEGMASPAADGDG